MQTFSPVQLVAQDTISIMGEPIPKDTFLLLNNLSDLTLLEYESDFDEGEIIRKYYNEYMRYYFVEIENKYVLTSIVLSGDSLSFSVGAKHPITIGMRIEELLPYYQQSVLDSGKGYDSNFDIQKDLEKLSSIYIPFENVYSFGYVSAALQFDNNLLKEIIITLIESE